MSRHTPGLTETAVVADSLPARCGLGTIEPHGSWERRKASAMGARVFGAFLEGGEPVGRIEIMPIEAAPVPLEGDGLWVIRCIWVLDKAKGLGIAGSLMRLALDAAEGSKGVAVLTYPGWMPPAFFESTLSGWARRTCTYAGSISPSAFVRG